MAAAFRRPASAVNWARRKLSPDFGAVDDDGDGGVAVCDDAGAAADVDAGGADEDSSVKGEPC